MDPDVVVNHSVKDVNPGWKVFEGHWTLLPIGATLVIMGIMFWGGAIGLDFPTEIVISIMIFASCALFVILFVNDKPDSYVKDLAKTLSYEAKTSLYLNGYLDSPPSLWKKGPAPRYPR